MENAIGFGSEHRKRHEQQETWVGDWLDTYFYPKISKDFARNKETETQKLGIDLYLTGKTTSITIDEKASVEWANCGLNKYSLELSLLSVDKNGNEKEINGWYMSNSLSSHFGIVFIDSATTVNDRYLTGSGITQATVVIINKHEFQNKLDELGWTKLHLKQKSDIIRKAYNEHGSDYWKYVQCGTLKNNGIHFFIQEKPREHGINIQFPKQFLIDNSDYAATVTTDKITVLHKI